MTEVHAHEFESEIAVHEAFRHLEGLENSNVKSIELVVTKYGDADE